MKITDDGVCISVADLRKKMQACYTTKKLNKLWGGKKLLNMYEFINLDIPMNDRMWVIEHMHHVFRTAKYQESLGFDFTSHLYEGAITIETFLYGADMWYPDAIYFSGDKEAQERILELVDTINGVLLAHYAT